MYKFMASPGQYLCGSLPYPVLRMGEAGLRLVS